LTSRYTLMEGNPPAEAKYPIFVAGKGHVQWLRELVYDLLRRAQGGNAPTVFKICARIVRGQDISISTFLLPFTVLNIVVGSDQTLRHRLAEEFLQVLRLPLQIDNTSKRDGLILCSQVTEPHRNFSECC